MQSHTLYLQAEQPGFRENETDINLDGVSVKVPSEETMMDPENHVLRRLTPEDMRAPVTQQDISEKMESAQSTTQPD